MTGGYSTIMEKARIQKIIAESGVCSRRKAEEMIEKGRGESMVVLQSLVTGRLVERILYQLMAKISTCLEKVS